MEIVCFWNLCSYPEIAVSTSVHIYNAQSKGTQHKSMVKPDGSTSL